MNQYNNLIFLKELTINPNSLFTFLAIDEQMIFFNAGLFPI